MLIAGNSVWEDWWLGNKRSPFHSPIGTNLQTGSRVGWNVFPAAATSKRFSTISQCCFYESIWPRSRLRCCNVVKKFHSCLFQREFQVISNHGDALHQKNTLFEQIRASLSNWTPKGTKNSKGLNEKKPMCLVSQFEKIQAALICFLGRNFLLAHKSLTRFELCWCVEGIALIQPLIRKKNILDRSQRPSGWNIPTKLENRNAKRARSILSIYKASKSSWQLVS